MTNPQTNQKLVLLLPQLKEASDIKASQKAGQWDEHPSKAFADVANSLDYEAPGGIKNISSVPTIWARPLTIEMVLYDTQHPLRRQMIREWQGMLTAIALAEVRGFPLKVELVELGSDKLAGEDFAKALSNLFPGYRGRNLYSLENKHPWQDIYIFLWENKPVGMTSPSTLVVPSELGEWHGLPWWNKEKKHLQFPYAYLNKNEQALLWHWLGNLNQELNYHQGDKAAINLIKGLISEFQSRLQQDVNVPFNLTEEPQFFGEMLNRGVLIALNKPVKMPEKPSNLRIIPSLEKNPQKPLLIIDSEIASRWNEKPQNVWVHGGKTLASIKMEELEGLQQRWQDVVLIKSEDLFLEDFYFIDQENALPGAMIPNPKEPLIFNSKKITPLLPINPILLDYFTPEDLVKKIIKLEPFSSHEGSRLKLMLDLPLVGMPGQKPPQNNFRIEKDYLIKSEKVIPEVPVLEVWPNLKARSWQEYYAFYYDGEYGEDTFKVNFPQAINPHCFAEGLGNYQISQLDSFPEYIQCFSKTNQLLGLIFLKVPRETPLKTSWRIGVDFGTSFTNIYVNTKGIIEPLKLENLHLKITESNIATRINVLFENFIAEEFIPSDKPLPLSSVLTTKGSPDANKNILHPVIDGRIYIPDNQRFKPQDDWMKTNLKWLTDNLRFNQVFLKHLALHITAIAAKAGVGNIDWSLSYPSVFSRRDKKNYARIWQEIIEVLDKKTGIKHHVPNIDSDGFRTESVAIAQYFADFEDQNLVYATCIDMGGGTSDISIWEENKLVHQCSVQLAGRDLFSQFLEMNPNFLQQRLGIQISDWRGLRAGAFNAKLDVWLRLESDKWLREQRPHLQNQEDLQGLVRLTAIGTAGLYYYVGIVLKALHEEGKYTRQEITPVYIGGNGSRFLNWLDDLGQFDSKSEINELLSRMLSQGSGFADTQEITRLSQNPKDEAACGLVLNNTRLTVSQRQSQEPVIAGESFIINGHKIEPTQRLDLDDYDYIEQVKVPELITLPKFLYDFHVALRKLGIEEIRKLPEYQRSPKAEDNPQLWKEVNRELMNNLGAIKGDAEDIRLEAPFIIGLKALLKVLGKQWAGK